MRVHTHARALEPTSLFELCQPSVYLSPASLAEDTFNTSSPSDTSDTHSSTLLYPKRLILLVIAAAAAVRRRAGYIITIAIIVALVSLTLVRLAPAYVVVTLGRCLLLILAAEPRGSSPPAPFVGGIHSRCEPITTSPIMHQPTHYLQSHAQAFNV